MWTCCLLFTLHGSARWKRVKQERPHAASSLGASYGVTEGLACEASTSGVQLVAQGPHVVLKGYKCSPTRIVNLLKIL